MGIRERIKEGLTKRCEQQYEKELAAKSVTYEEWLAGHDSDLGTRGQAAGRQQDGTILLLQASDGVLASGAEDRIRSYFDKHPEVMIAYGDEDVQDPVTCELRIPWFKPDWSPDTFLSEMYWGNVVAIRKEWLENLQEKRQKI